MSQSRRLLIPTIIIVGVYTDSRIVEQVNHARSTLIEIILSAEELYGTILELKRIIPSVCQWQTIYSKTPKPPLIWLYGTWLQKKEGIWGSPCTRRNLWFAGQMFLGQSLFTNPLYHLKYNTRDVEANQWNNSREAELLTRMTLREDRRMRTKLKISEEMKNYHSKYNAEHYLCMWKWKRRKAMLVKRLRMCKMSWQLCIQECDVDVRFFCRFLFFWHQTANISFFCIRKL